MSLSQEIQVIKHQSLDGSLHDTEMAADLQSVYHLVSTVPAPPATTPVALGDWIIANRVGLTQLINLINADIAEG